MTIPTGDFSFPAKTFVAVTPSNTANLASVCRALFVGTGGDLAAIGDDGSAVTFKNVPSGAVLPVRTIRVNSTNTTATDIVALY